MKVKNSLKKCLGLIMLLVLFFIPQIKVLAEQSNEIPSGYKYQGNKEILSSLEKEMNETLKKSRSSSDVDLTGKMINISFVIDTTGSMGSSINNVKRNLTMFVDRLSKSGADIRFNLVDFQDITYDGIDSTTVHHLSGSPWTNKSDIMINELNSLRLGDGGDWPETPWDGLGYLTDDQTIKFNSDAYKFAYLLTDADYKENNKHGIKDIYDMADRLNSRGIMTSVVTDPSYFELYRPLYERTGGTVHNIYGDFQLELKEFAERILTVVANREAIYVLPDMIDSKLVDNSGATIWKDNKLLNSNVEKYKSTSSTDDKILSLNDSGKNSGNLKVDIENDKYGINEQYKDLLEELSKIDGKEVIYYPYDWRLDTTEISQEIQKDIVKRGYGKVDFVSVGSGGNIASNYLKNNPGKAKTTRLISIGTPYYGSLSSLELLELGSNNSVESILSEIHNNKNLTKKWFRDNMINSPSLYQTLPNKQNINIATVKLDGFVQNQDGVKNLLKDKKETLNNGLVDNYSSYTNTIGDINNVAQKNKALFIGSTGVMTNRQVEYKTNSKGQVTLSKFVKTLNGDGTHQLFSTQGLPNENIKPVDTINHKYLTLNGVSHTELVSNKDVINNVSNFIKTGETLTKRSSRVKSKSSEKTMRDMISVEVFDNDDEQVFSKDFIITDKKTGEIVASAIGGEEKGFDSVKFSIDYMNFDMTSAVIYMPSKGYELTVKTHRLDDSVTEDINIVVSTLDDIGDTISKATIKTSQEDKEFSLDLSEINDNNIKNLKAYETEVKSSETTEIKDIIFDTNMTESIELIEITNSIKELEKDEVYQFKGRTVPTDKKIIWTSSDSSIIDITEDGLATAKNYGKAFIYAMSEDKNKVDVVEVTVVRNPDSLEFDAESIKLEPGDTYTMTPIFKPVETTNKNIKYSSSDEAVIEISEEGIVTAKNEGKAKITAITDNGKTAELEVIVVKNIPVRGIEFESVKYDVNLNEEKEIAVVFSPENATNKKLDFSADNDNIEIKQGSKDEKINIKGLKVGTSQVTVVSHDGGYAAQVTINIIDKKPNTSIATAWDIEEGQKVELSESRKHYFKIVADEDKVYKFNYNAIGYKGRVNIFEEDMSVVSLIKLNTDEDQTFKLKKGQIYYVYLDASASKNIKDFEIK